jgi:hypothetical protein
MIDSDILPKALNKVTSSPRLNLRSLENKLRIKEIFYLGFGDVKTFKAVPTPYI